jgi:hypothetical protein
MPLVDLIYGHPALEATRLSPSVDLPHSLQPTSPFSPENPTLTHPPGRLSVAPTLLRAENILEAKRTQRISPAEKVSLSALLVTAVSVVDIVVVAAVAVAIIINELLLLLLLLLRMQRQHQTMAHCFPTCQHQHMGQNGFLTTHRPFSADFSS